MDEHSARDNAGHSGTSRHQARRLGEVSAQVWCDGSGRGADPRALESVVRALAIVDSFKTSVPAIMSYPKPDLVGNADGSGHEPHRDFRHAPAQRPCLREIVVDHTTNRGCALVRPGSLHAWDPGH